ncbi:hypothetical protein [Methylocella sp.]|jgi:hypothetical protein|uniref:hypothetical protein n=1 Tax=Methylocella sp. TaxID=1978226 RepID=UPI003C1C226F
MKSRTLLAGAGFCILAAVAIESADRYLFRQAAAAVAARVDGLTFAGISAEPWRGEARIDGLDWRRRGSSLHVRAVKFAPPRLFPLAGAALAGLGEASADDLTLETGLSVYRIKRIVLVGASLSSAGLLQLFDPKNTEPLAERLVALTAASIAIPEMTVETKTGTATQTFIYRDILLNGISAGKAAEANIAGISFSILDPRTGDADGAYGKVSAKDVDLVLAAKILSETRDQENEPKRELFNAIDIDGFHLGGAQGELDIRRLTAATVTGRAPLRPWREAATAVAEPSTSGAQRSALLAAFVDAFGSDDLTATEIGLNFRKEANATRLTIGRASISLLDGPRIDGVEAQNLVFARPSGRISVESLSFRGLDLRPLTNSDRAPNLLGEDLRPDFEQIAMTKLEGRLTPTEDADASSGSTFEVERFAIERAAPKDAARSGLNVSLDHFTAPAGDGGVFSTLAAMGYERLDLSSRLDVIWSEASSELAINSFSLDGADMGSLNITAQFSNVTLDLASRDERVAAAAAHSVLIKKLDLHVENAGLFDKALAVQAKNEKQSVDEARQSDILKATLLLPALLGNEAPARALGAALAKFIAAPKNFSLQALAPEGIGIADLEFVQTPGALLKKIEVTAAANQ